MNVTTSDITDTRKELTVSYTGEETAAEDRKLIAELTKEAKIPGFRPGKAPPAMIRQRYAKEMVAELSRALVNKAYEKGVKESALQIISVVKVDGAEKPVPGTEASIVFTVDIAPAFELPQYKGVATDVPSTEVSDEEVEAALQNLRKQRSNFNVVEREANPGDYVRLTYKGTVDGTLISELAPDQPMWGTQENTWEEAGTPAETMVGVPGIVNGVVGMKKGDTKEVTHDFPAEFETAALAGKHAIYTLEVLEVRERVLPELDEAFLKQHSAETVEQMRSNLLDDLTARKQHERLNLQRKQITEKIGAAVDFPLPESLVESVHQDLMREIMESNIKKGVPMDEFEKNKEEFYTQTKPMAYQRAKMDLVLAKIAETEKITVTNDDFSRAIYQEAIRTRTRPEDLVKKIQKDRSMIDNLRQQLLFGKTLDLLCKEAIVNIVELPPASA